MLQYIDFIMLLKILADAMGLGKTIMTISLLLAHSERVGSSVSLPTSQSSSEGSEVNNVLDNSANLPRKVTKFSDFDKLKKKNMLIDGGNLIICPMTLLNQWKVLSFLVFIYIVVLHTCLICLFERL